MGRRRKSDPKGKADPAKVHPATPPAFGLPPITPEALARLKAMIETGRAARPQLPIPEPQRRILTDDELERLLVAIQDGEVEYGREDCEVIGELICEVLEYRRRTPAPFTPFRAAPATATQTQIETARRFGAERAEYERRVAALEKLSKYGQGLPTGRVKGEPFWQAEPERDVQTLYAPNGQKLYSVSGLDMMQMKNPGPEMRAIAAREFEKWKANGGTT